MVVKRVIILLMLYSLVGCAISLYQSAELVSEKDQYTGIEILDTRISFPQVASQTLVIFRQLKNETTSSYYLVGRFWMEDWAFFNSVDILIDNKNHRIESVDTKRDVKSNASVEEIIYFNINNEIIAEFGVCTSLKMRFNGEKRTKEIIFDAEKIDMVKRWVTHINI
ncbi:MAG: hypothetical protein QQN55_08305 [Nitrosopumilus sp.]